jgi:hypothetical protein
MLSTLWIFAMFNYIYADILTLYFAPALQKEATQQLQAGQMGSLLVTQGAVLAGAVSLETAMAMVLLSRILDYGVNRWANVLVALLQTALVAWSLNGQLYANLFYEFFAAIEIACTLFIVWYAWTWSRPKGGALSRV